MTTERYLHALETLDVEAFRAATDCPAALSDHVVTEAMHTARANCSELRGSLRLESVRWLRENIK